jgi:hypothetical protein
MVNDEWRRGPSTELRVTGGEGDDGPLTTDDREEVMSGVIYVLG